jgi:hypothetical protein
MSAGKKQRLQRRIVALEMLLAASKERHINAEKKLSEERARHAFTSKRLREVEAELATLKNGATP